MHKNYFEIFDLSMDYRIDQTMLKEKYIAMQKIYHPDKNKVDVSFSFDLNMAYKCLNNDVDRAIYLLKILGTDINDEQNNIKADDEILEDIMLLREKIYETKDLPSLLTIEKELRSDLAFVTELFSNNFTSNNINMHVIQLAMKMQYLRKTLLDLKTLKSQMV